MTRIWKASYIKPKTCSVCGTVFQPKSWNCKMTPYCSTKCKAEARAKRAKKVMATCLQYGSEFEVLGRKLYQVTTGRTYCSKKCSSLAQAAASSLRMSETNRKYASDRMKNNNPMANDATRLKMSQSLKGRPFKNRGGNGQYTAHQQKLFDGLCNLYSVGFAMEFPVCTAEASVSFDRLPNCYKVDIGYPSQKIAIEVDGRSHNSKTAKEKDALKTKVLEALGWKVLRFSNEEVDRNLNACVQAVWSTILK